MTTDSIIDQGLKPVVDVSDANNKVSNEADYVICFFDRFRHLVLN